MVNSWAYRAPWWPMAVGGLIFLASLAWAARRGWPRRIEDVSRPTLVGLMVGGFFLGGGLFRLAIGAPVD